MGPIQPLLQWAPRLSPRYYRGRGVKLATSAEVKNGEAVPPLTHMPLWRGT
jgi:hypothetical protein